MKILFMKRGSCSEIQADYRSENLYDAIASGDSSLEIARSFESYGQSFELNELIDLMALKFSKNRTVGFRIFWVIFFEIHKIYKPEEREVLKGRWAALIWALRRVFGYRSFQTIRLLRRGVKACRDSLPESAQHLVCEMNFISSLTSGS